MVKKCITCGTDFMTDGKRKECRHCVEKRISEYGKKQKQQTLSRVQPVIVNSLLKQVEEDRNRKGYSLIVEPEIREDTRKEMEKFKKTVKEKEKQMDKYLFLKDIKKSIQVLLKADLDLQTIIRVESELLENGIRKLYREENK